MSHPRAKPSATISTLHGPLALPAFLPDATRGVLRAVDSADIQGCGLSGLMVNALHLSVRPGLNVISSFGGIHAFMGWPGVITADSGGYQVLSLIESGLASVTRKGFVYGMSKEDRKRILTPEKSIQIQFQARADVMYCLDQCTHPKQSIEVQVQGVERTIDWARRCKEEFRRQVEQRGMEQAPLLFAVIQGGADRQLRGHCAEALREIGFDGYGYGGWPIDEQGQLLEMVAHVASLVPEGSPLHALGVGKPESLYQAWAAGYSLFDCVLPTRDARGGRLYAMNAHAGQSDFGKGGLYEYVYMQDKLHMKDSGPVDESCDCPLCQDYSRGYLHHLFRINDHLAYRLATIHNLRFYARVMQRLSALSV